MEWGRKRATNKSNQSWRNTRYAWCFHTVKCRQRTTTTEFSSSFSVRPSSFSKIRRTALFTFVRKARQFPILNLPVKFQTIFARSHPSFQNQLILARRIPCRHRSPVQRSHRKRSDSAQSCWSYGPSKPLQCRREMLWLLLHRDHAAMTRLSRYLHSFFATYIHEFTVIDDKRKPIQRFLTLIAF
jgi:hypothetical protein